MRKYENINPLLNNEINDKLKHIESEKIRTRTIPTERQYMFLTFLQEMPLTDKQVFDIYTNTKLK